MVTSGELRVRDAALLTAPKSAGSGALGSTKDLRMLSQQLQNRIRKRLLATPEVISFVLTFVESKHGRTESPALWQFPGRRAAERGDSPSADERSCGVISDRGAGW